MTPEQIEFAQRLAAHPAFKWLPGMCAINEHARRWRLVANVTIPGHFAEGEGHNNRILGWERTGSLLGGLPDLTDPATVGCLLALAREVLGNPTLYVAPIFEFDGRELYVAGWTVYPGDHRVSPTEGEALALAILGVV
jgi:hypothetical protein